MPLYALGEHVPQIAADVYLHPDCVIIGQVIIGAGSSVWPGAVLRGDTGRIEVGERTSIQDGVVVHVSRSDDTVIGSDCVVGHLAHLEGCTVEDGALIGVGSVVLARAVVGAGSLVAAGAVVTPGTQVPPLATAKGVPARITPDSVAPGAYADSAARYAELGRRYAAELRRID